MYLKLKIDSTSLTVIMEESIRELIMNNFAMTIRNKRSMPIELTLKKIKMNQKWSLFLAT